MCFRPAEADVRVPVKCRECGKRINPVQDVYPEFCPFCKCENPAEGAEPFYASSPVASPTTPEVAAPPAPKAPAAPPAPKGPAA